MTTILQREDWTLFRNLNTLGQRAGVTQDVIPRLVVKELVDNALDAGCSCQFGTTKDGGIYVDDDGGGLPGDDVQIAALFSVARPLASSKLLRVPTRGALGNGLRVVAGAVLASGGQLTVKTRGRALRLRPRDSDGGTDVEHLGPWKGTGTQIEVLLGDAITVEENAFIWAKLAVWMAKGETYKGKTSPWWYDADSFYELTQAAGCRTIRELVEQFAGCSGARAGKLAAGFSGRPCESLTRGETEGVLTAMRSASRQVNPKRLGSVGPQLSPDAGYAREAGTFKASAARGKVSGQIPYVVEAWAEAGARPSLQMYVNRTPITADVSLSRCLKDDKSAYGLMGCGLSSEHRNTALGVKAGRGREFSVVVNVTTPHMPITTDGKAPDLSAVEKALQVVIEKAIRCAKRRQPTNGRQTTQVAIITGSLPAAIDKASGKGQYRYSQRQLFYAVRPYVLGALGIEPDYDYFAKVITDYESDKGTDLPGMYRDDRGTLCHPHTGKSIPLGTRSVEAYRRPDWTFNKILYCEKEGFFPILIDAQWPERHDCALLTSKGFASRAARDVLDLLGDSDQPLTFYCLHDADGPGTMIYQTLQEGTRARPGRRVEIVNLGLEPDEAIKLGLPVEQVERKNKRAVPVADYVAPEWREWLQRRRVELNAMDTPSFLKWLNNKIGESDKLIPPAPVLTAKLASDTRMLIRNLLVEEAIRNANVDARTDAAIVGLQPQIAKLEKRLPSTVRKELGTHPARHWTAPVGKMAERLARGADGAT